MLMWANKPLCDHIEPAHIAYEVAKTWVVNVLNLQTSDKHRFIHPGPAAEAALHGCRVHDCTAKVSTHGVDLGVDTVAGLKRETSLTSEHGL